MRGGRARKEAAGFPSDAKAAGRLLLEVFAVRPFCRPVGPVLA